MSKAQSQTDSSTVLPDDLGIVYLGSIKALACYSWRPETSPSVFSQRTKENSANFAAMPSTTYALPAAAIPSRHHHHSSEHIHMPNHSRSPPSLSSLHTPRSHRASDPAPNGSANMHHHEHGHALEHNHAQFRPNSNHSSKSRSNAPPALANGHWKTDSTAGGKPLITPSHASFDAAGTYQAPTPSDPQHDRIIERSRFTNFLLPYTSKWPLLHAIVAEKDSRRIFYFMSYVSPRPCRRAIIFG